VATEAHRCRARLILRLISGLVDGLKLRAAEMLWSLPKRNPDEGERDKARQRLLTDGCCVLENFLDRAAVERLVTVARAAYETDTEFVSLESNGSDRRIYGVDRLHSVFAMEHAMSYPDALSRAFYRSHVEWFQVLGNIRFSNNNLGSGSGWHRDSPFSHQFKAILYLSEVDQENGPFQYVRGSHLKESVRSAARCLGIRPRSYRFSSEQIETLREAGVIPTPTTFTGSPGTLLLIDSRGLHRGAPLRAGERLAVTRYYFAGGVPTEFAAHYPLTVRRRSSEQNRA
jgi:Phytanoyl-CoA dioxygenase (PhyH)